MLFNGIKLVEGSEIQSLIVDAGTLFPGEDGGPPGPPSNGEMFFITGDDDGHQRGLYIYDEDDEDWVRQASEDDDFAALLDDIVTAGTYRSVTINAKGLVTAGTNPTTLSGYGITDAQPLSTSLSNIAGLAGTSGLLRKTGASTWALDTNTYLTTNQNINITGDVSGSGTTSISLTLATVNSNVGSFGSASGVGTFTVNGKGLVTAAATTPIAIAASQVTSGEFADARIAESNVTQHEEALTISEDQITDGSIFARLADDEVVTGSWSFDEPVSGADPTDPTHFTTKQYVDGIAAGSISKAAVVVATTEDITLSGLQEIDGYTVEEGDRVLVKDQDDASENGVYIASEDAWERSEDMDGTPTSEVKTGNTVFVTNGDENANTSWIIVSSDPITVGSSNIEWSLFSRTGGFNAVGGLSIVGNNISVETASSSRIVVSATNIDLATTGVGSGTFAQVTVDAYGRVTAGSTTLSFDNITDRPDTLADYGITDAQPLDSDLTALAALGTTGILTRTGDATFVARTLATEGVGLSIENADGVDGAPTIVSNATEENEPSTIVSRDASGNFSANEITASVFNGSVTEADRWSTGRTLTISGDASGVAADVDGSEDITIGITLSDTGVTAGSYGSPSQVPTLSVDSAGRITSISENPITAAAAGDTGQVQFNNEGTLNGSALFTFDNSTGELTLSALTENSFLFVGEGGTLTSTDAPEDGQLLIGVTDGAPVLGTLTEGDGITITNGEGSITIDNAGVLSLTGTTNQISVSASTGTVTLSLPQDINAGASPTFDGANFSGIPNDALDESAITVTAGAGMSGGGSVSLGGEITLDNAGVTSLTGTSNQVNVSASTGGVTLSLPQSIGTSSSPTFSGLTLSGLTANAFIYAGSGGVIESTDSAPTNGQILIGRTGNTPVAATITGTSNQVTVTNGSGTITLSLPQSIGTSSNVTFGNLTLTGTSPSLLINHGSGSGGNGITLRSSGTNKPSIYWNDGTNDLGGIRFNGSNMQIGIGAFTSKIDINGSSGVVSINDDLTISGFTQYSATSGITAAGSTQGTATALTTTINKIDTASSNTGVVLPNATGSTFIVINDGANAVKVYPPSGGQIDYLGTNNALEMPAGSRIMFVQTGSTPRYFTLNATYA